MADTYQGIPSSPEMSSRSGGGATVGSITNGFDEVFNIVSNVEKSIELLVGVLPPMGPHAVVDQKDDPLLDRWYQSLMALNARLSQLSSALDRRLS